MPTLNMPESTQLHRKRVRIISIRKHRAIVELLESAPGSTVGTSFRRGDQLNLPRKEITIDT